jgi:hypothetical protein
MTDDLSLRSLRGKCRKQAISLKSPIEADQTRFCLYTIAVIKRAGLTAPVVRMAGDYLGAPVRDRIYTARPVRAQPGMPVTLRQSPGSEAVGMEGRVRATSHRYNCRHHTEPRPNVRMIVCAGHSSCGLVDTHTPALSGGQPLNGAGVICFESARIKASAKCVMRTTHGQSILSRTSKRLTAERLVDYQTFSRRFRPFIFECKTDAWAS